MSLLLLFRLLFSTTPRPRLFVYSAESDRMYEFLEFSKDDKFVFLRHKLIIKTISHNDYLQLVDNGTYLELR